MKDKFRIKKFNRRLVLSGNVLEYYEYEKPIVKGLKMKLIGRAASAFTSEETKAENRKKTAQRSRITVRRYANANPQLSKFLTLTFAENQQDLAVARYELDKFLKRVKTRYKDLQYICVVEFQVRGAIHFHMLCNLPYVSAEELAELWGNGFIKINRIDNVDNVGAYITKYMTKETFDERLAGKKCYSMSKNLQVPEEYTQDEDIDEVLENLENVIRVNSSEFESEYYGVVHYTQIVCSEQPKKPNAFRRLLKRFENRLTPLPDSTPTPFD